MYLTAGLGFGVLGWVGLVVYGILSDRDWIRVLGCPTCYGVEVFGIVVSRSILWVWGKRGYVGIDISFGLFTIWSRARASL